MIRSFLIHLSRFVRMYLLACFICILVLPILYNCLEIMGFFFKSDILYLGCALLPAVAGLIYVYQIRARINSDELYFFIHNRLRYDHRFVKDYFALSGVLIRDICGYHWEERRYLIMEQVLGQLRRQAALASGAAAAAAGTASGTAADSTTGTAVGTPAGSADGYATAKSGAGQPTDANGTPRSYPNSPRLYIYGEVSHFFGAENNNLVLMGDYTLEAELVAKAEAIASELVQREALVFIDTMLDMIGLTGELLEQAQKSYLQALKSKQQVSDYFKFLHYQQQKRGPYFCEYILATLLRSMLGVGKESSIKDSYYQQFLQHPLMRELGQVLLEQDIDGNYFNRYFHILAQEQFKLKRRHSTAKSHVERSAQAQRQAAAEMAKRERAYQQQAEQARQAREQQAATQAQSSAQATAQSSAQASAQFQDSEADAAQAQQEREQKEAELAAARAREKAAEARAAQQAAEQAARHDEAIAFNAWTEQQKKLAQREWGTEQKTSQDRQQGNTEIHLTITTTTGSHESAIRITSPQIATNNMPKQDSGEQAQVGNSHSSHSHPGTSHSGNAHSEQVNSAQSQTGPTPSDQVQVETNHAGQKQDEPGQDRTNHAGWRQSDPGQAEPSHADRKQTEQSQDKQDEPKDGPFAGRAYSSYKEQPKWSWGTWYFSHSEYGYQGAPFYYQGDQWDDNLHEILASPPGGNATNEDKQRLTELEEVSSAYDEQQGWLLYGTPSWGYRNLAKQEQAKLAFWESQDVMRQARALCEREMRLVLQAERRFAREHEFDPNFALHFNQEFGPNLLERYFDEQQAYAKAQEQARQTEQEQARQKEQARQAERAAAAAAAAAAAGKSPDEAAAEAEAEAEALASLPAKVRQAYRDLRVSALASLSEIKRQYRKLAFRFHPDHVPDYQHLSAEAQQELNTQFIKLSRAYTTILEYWSEHPEMAQATAH